MYLLKWELVDSQNKVMDVLELNRNTNFVAKIVMVIQGRRCKIHQNDNAYKRKNQITFHELKSKHI